MRAYGTGQIIRKSGTNNLYIRFRQDGKYIQRATGTTDEREAQRQLNAALGAVATGTASPVGSRTITYEDLRAAYLTEKPSAENYHGLQHLDEFFASATVKQFNERELVEKFVTHRRREHCSDATIRRNLNPLKAMFRLAVRRKKIGHNDVPYFPSLEDSPASANYISPEQFAQILAALPTADSIKKANARVSVGKGRGNGKLLRGRVREFHDLRPFFTFLYSTGCRVGAAQRIRWDMLSKDCRVLTLPAELIKNRTPLTLVLDGPMLQSLAVALRKRFRNDGKAIFDSTNYRPEWNKACDAAGVRGYDAETRKRDDNEGGRIHDMRCSGAMNLLRAGVDESTVLKIGGWKTRAMLDRYNKPTEEVIADAIRKAGEFVARKIAK